MRVLKNIFSGGRKGIKYDGNEGPPVTYCGEKNEN
jgi:hypothetical protein